jgi:hypothetical protein
MNIGKCPKCDKLLTQVQAENMEIHEGLISRWKGASFLCPFCHTILSVGLDPLALKADLVTEILERLGRKG